MKVLITNNNIDLVQKLAPVKLTFEMSTLNTSTFKITEKSFIKLRDNVRTQGINPYSLLSW